MEEAGQMIVRLNRKQETFLWCLAVAYGGILLVFLLTDAESLFSRMIVITAAFGALGAATLYSMGSETRYIRQWRQIARSLRVLGYCSAAVGALALLLGVAAIAFHIRNGQLETIKHLRIQIVHLQTQVVLTRMSELVEDAKNHKTLKDFMNTVKVEIAPETVQAWGFDDLPSMMAFVYKVAQSQKEER